VLALCAEQELLSKEHHFPREVCWSSTKQSGFFFKLKVPAKYYHQGVGDEGEKEIYEVQSPLGRGRNLPGTAKWQCFLC